MRRRDPGAIVCVMEEITRYNYRLRPGAEAERALISEWDRCRFVWNDAVEKMKAGERSSFPGLAKLLTEKRANLSWLSDGAQMPQQQTLRKFSFALSQSFKTAAKGRPKFKSSRKSLPSLNYVGKGFSVENGRLSLVKGPTIPLVWSRDMPSKPSSVCVYRDNLGHWYASFIVRRERVESITVSGGIGIDWGVKATATTTSDDFDLPALGHRKRVAGEMASAQRKMARRKRPKGQAASNGYMRAKMEAAKISKKAQRRNLHDSRIWAGRVVENHQLIAVEDFRPKFLTKTTMARKVADSAIGTVKRTLIDYAERAGREVVLVQPAYTTMTCSGCFARAKRLNLDERTFTCHTCGLVEDRDKNAARVILAVAERNHTTVDDVRREVAQAGSGALTEVETGTKKPGR